MTSNKLIFFLAAAGLSTGCFNPGQVFMGDTEAGGSTSIDSSATDTPTETGTASSAASTTAGSSGVDTATGTLPTTGSSDTSAAGSESSSGGIVCENGLSACGTGSCDIDVMTDAAHCGACGHDCLGGECQGGQCSPVSIFLEGDLRDLAADEDFVYFSTGSTLERIPQEPDAPSSILDNTGPEGAPSKRDIAVSGDYVVLAGGTPSEGFVTRYPKDGGAGLDLYVDTPTAGGVQTLRLTTNRAFWATRSPSSPYVYSIFGDTLDGSDETIYVADSEDNVWTFGANNAFVFYLRRDAEGRIQRRSVAAGTSMDILSGFQNCQSIVPTEERLFFSCQDFDYVGSLHVSDLDGANHQVLLTEGRADFVDGRALTYRDGRLTWWDIEDGTYYLRDVAEDGSDLRNLYSTAVPVVNGRLAMDSEAYFFAKDATVQMLAR